MNGSMKVTPEQLIQAQEDLQVRIQEVHLLYGNVSVQMEELSGMLWASGMKVWKEKVQQAKEREEQLIGQMKAHVEKLNEIARIYETTERRNANADPGN